MTTHTDVTTPRYSPPPPLTENQIIERVLLLDQRTPAERARYLSSDSAMRAAIRGEIPRKAMTYEERRAFALGRGRAVELEG